MTKQLQTEDAWRKAGVPLANQYPLPLLLPYVDEQLLHQLPQLVGFPFTSWLLEQDSADTRSASYTKLVPFLSGPIAKLAFLAYLPFAEMSLDSAGLTVSALDGRKSAPERNVRI